jgi:hypothetical protein
MGKNRKKQTEQYERETEEEKIEEEEKHEI